RSTKEARHMTQTAERRTYIGQSVPRREDAALITGRATWTDGITPAGTLHMAVVRSPVAHARIRGVDTAAARALPGVVAVFTGADLAGDFAIGLPIGWPVPVVLQNTEHHKLAPPGATHFVAW